MINNQNIHVSVMTPQINFRTHITQLTNLLSQPILNLETWIKALTLFHACIQEKIIGQKQSHLSACQQTLQALAHTQKIRAMPKFIGIELSDWLFVIQHMILKQQLIHFLDKQKAREILFFSQLFKRDIFINPAYIHPQAFKISTMMQSLIQYNYLRPNQPLFSGWLISHHHLQNLLPTKATQLIYAFLFLPPNLSRPLQSKIISNISLTKQQKKMPTFDMNTIQPFLHKSNHQINHEDLLSFLLIHNSYTLIDIFTAIIPLPWMDLANLMASMPPCQKEFLIEKLAPYTIHHTQLYSLIALLKTTSNQEKKIDLTTLQHWIDVCQYIYDQNIALMARRQQQIRYICQHPVGVKSLEQVLIHFKTPIENPYEWLTPIFIDQYTVTSKDMLLPFTYKNHISEYLIERMFNPNHHKPQVFIQLRKHFISEVRQLITTYVSARHWLSFKWLFGIERSEDLLLYKQTLNQAMDAFELETDFTKVIRYIRHITEKNHYITHMTDKSLFSKISEIDLACTLHPALST
ncbi:MAG: hypothetical protein P8L77_06120 [Gammaproteobacteria bacterium]|nr:hypothetical protein [Gammaproteobacteria bacterium]